MLGNWCYSSKKIRVNPEPEKKILCVVLELLITGTCDKINHSAIIIIFFHLKIGLVVLALGARTNMLVLAVSITVSKFIMDLGYAKGP